MKEILVSIRRAPYQSLAAFLVLFFTLFLSTALFFSLSFLHGILGYVETRPQVTVYFQPKTPEPDIFRIRDEVVNTGKTLSVKYVSQTEALKIYKEMNKDNPLLLEMVSSDILPASLEVFAQKPSYLSEIADFLKKQPPVDEVSFQKDIVDRLMTLTSILRKITIVFFTFLLMMSIIVLTTTTMFKIALKKDEIELLRLLGATSFYVKKPFLVEGVYYALFSTLASFLILAAIIFYFNPFLGSYLGDINNLNLNFGFFELTVWPINVVFLTVTFGLSFLFGVGIAVVANLLATNKYLK
jgi:cell division transport system permease protein